MRESVVEKYLVKTVKALGGEAMKFTSPGRRHVSDRLCVLPFGKVYFIETKAPTKKPRPGQVRFIKRMTALGVHCAVLDTKEMIDWYARRMQRQIIKGYR